MEQGVNQGVLTIARAGMNDQTGGLIDNEQIVVFKDNMERNSFRPIFCFLWRRFDQANAIARTDQLARPGRFAVKGGGAGAN